MDPAHAVDGEQDPQDSSGGAAHAPESAGTAQPPKTAWSVQQTWSQSFQPRRLRATDPASAPLAEEQNSNPADGTPVQDAKQEDVPVSGLTMPTKTPEYPVHSWARYEFLGLLGVGGMASVYKARDRKLGRVVALKFSAQNNENSKRRFMQEARAQSRIDHPGVCKIFEVGEVEGKAYIAMQLIDGCPLDQAKHDLSREDKVRLAMDTAKALHCAHELGVIHRDIKPSNIMVEVLPEGGFRPILMDFGIARDAVQQTKITETGAVVGTLAYMSPEQARGDTQLLDRRTDIYSMGATLFELLAGHPPFQSSFLAETLINGLVKEAPSLSAAIPEIPKALDVIVGKCLNKDPEQRYATAKELADDLWRFLNHERIVGKKVGLYHRLRWRVRQNKTLAAVAAALLVSLLFLAGYAIQTRVQSLRKDRLAREQTALAHRLGQSVGELEWLTRVIYMMPLHDNRADLDRIRQRMAEIEAQMRSYGEFGAGLGDYALGRGYLAQHEWTQAYEHLRRAQASGFDSQELAYALGRALGELYTTGLAAARTRGDKSFFLQRRKELEQQFLAPARAYLAKARGLTTASTSYVEGLIDFYNERYESALQHAQTVQAQANWQYEAIKLVGDVHMARALDKRDHGDYDLAERSFADALHAYAAASEIGRSDNQLYEASAEGWVRLMEMDSLRGQDPGKRLERTLAAAEQAIAASPTASNGYTKKAFAFLFVAREKESHRSDPIFLETTNRLIEAGEQAVRLHPEDVYARDALGNGYIYLAQFNLEQKKPHLDALRKAKEQFSTAISIQPRFPWGYNDLGRAYLIEGDDILSRHEDPTQPYQSAIAAFKEAVALDSEYQFGHTNMAMTYAWLARYAVEYGKDPTPYLDALDASAMRILSINEKSIDAYGAIILGGVLKAFYDLESSGNVIDTIEKGNRYIDKLLLLNPDLPVAYEHLAFSNYMLARWQFDKMRDPTVALQNGLSAVHTCDKLRGGDGGLCVSLEALLLILQAQQQQRQGHAFEKPLESAQAKARQALSQATTDTEVLQLAAEALWRAAVLRQALRLPAAQAIEDGLAGIDRALAVAPSWPRALAIKGALYVSQAQSSTSEPARQLSFTHARPLLTKALAGNSLLRNVYPEAFTELATQSALPTSAQP